nr:transporter substrate-binding domain-containing protein [Marinicella sp. W31]MDC2877327.1 transporter substrate-binding domain-containing protein [Marinicella sp. W31]
MFNTKKIMAAVVAALMLQAPATIAADTLQDRIDDGTVTIGIHNRAPWGFRTESGDVAGFHPDLVREALEPLGITDIDFVVTEFGALIPGLQAHRFDMIASGIAITSERCKQVIFSEPDLSVVDAVIVKKGNPKNIHSFADIAEGDFTLAGGRGTLNTSTRFPAACQKTR